MEIDWTQIRGALARIENELSKAERLIKQTDVGNEWPEVSRSELEAAFPQWRLEYGNNWIRDFMEKKIGRENYRIRRGSSKYRISPECLKTLHIQQEGQRRQ